MKDIIKIILGNILISIAYAFITVPNEIVNGGVTSFSLILGNITSVDIRIIVNVVTILLLGVCLLCLGKEYFLKSILSSVCYIGFFNLFYSFSIIIEFNKVILMIIAAVTVALGYYLCLDAKSTTVGFDILAVVLNKKNNKINIAIAMRYINLFVILLGLLNYGVEAIILGVAFTLIQTQSLKYLLNRKSIN